MNLFVENCDLCPYTPVHTIHTFDSSWCNRWKIVVPLFSCSQLSEPTVARLSRFIRTSSPATYICSQIQSLLGCSFASRRFTTSEYSKLKYAVWAAVFFFVASLISSHLGLIIYFREHSRWQQRQMTENDNSVTRRRREKMALTWNHESQIYMGLDTSPVQFLLCIHANNRFQFGILPRPLSFSVMDSFDANRITCMHV